MLKVSAACVMFVLSFVLTFSGHASIQITEDTEKDGSIINNSALSSSLSNLNQLVELNDSHPLHVGRTAPISVPSGDQWGDSYDFSLTYGVESIPLNRKRLRFSEGEGVCDRDGMNAFYSDQASESGADRYQKKGCSSSRSADGSWPVFTGGEGEERSSFVMMHSTDRINGEGWIFEDDSFGLEQDDLIHSSGNENDSLLDGMLEQQDEWKPSLLDLSRSAGGVGVHSFMMTQALAGLKNLKFQNGFIIKRRYSI